MADIHDINIDDAKQYITINGGQLPANDDELIYLMIKMLMKRQNVKYTPDIITKWMIANNAIKNKIQIPKYTEYQLRNLILNERKKLATKLAMKGNNIDNIIDILRFLHKLEKGVDFDYLYNVDYKDLNLKDPELQDIFKDQNFWKRRIEHRFGLKTNENKRFDYHFIAKYLDDGKSISEHSKEIAKGGYTIYSKISQINDLLYFNDWRKPETFLRNSNLTVIDLIRHKNKPFEEFIKLMELLSGRIFGNEIFYKGDEIVITFPYLADDDLQEEEIILHNDNGFTERDVLYGLAKNFPLNIKDAEEFYGKELKIKYLARDDNHHEKYIFMTEK